MTRMEEVALRDGAEILDDLKHAVGYPRFYRNSFNVSLVLDDGADRPCLITWRLLEGLGLAKAGPVLDGGGSMYFSVTPAGLAFLKAVSQ